MITDDMIEDWSYGRGYIVEINVNCKKLDS